MSNLKIQKSQNPYVSRVPDKANFRNTQNPKIMKVLKYPIQNTLDIPSLNNKYPKIPKVQIPRPQNNKVPEYQSLKIPKSQNAYIPE